MSRADADAATQEEWEDFGYVAASGYRLAVVDRLADGPATPSTIADASDYQITHVSRALRELRERDIVDLLVSEDTRKGRVHGLTERGHETSDLLEEHGGGA